MNSKNLFDVLELLKQFIEWMQDGIKRYEKLNDKCEVQDEPFN